MSEFQSILSALRRPRLLVRAARFGLDEYQRDKDLRRILRCQRPPSPPAALKSLIEEEARIENNRTSGDGTYTVARHVDVLIALMAEIRTMMAQGRTNLI